MPYRCTARFRICAAAIAAVYLAPTLLPALSGLSHSVFHLVAEPVAAHTMEYAHPHVHTERDTAHSHSQLVDALLSAEPVAEDILEQGHSPAPLGTAPGAHLPQAVVDLDPLPTPDSGPSSGMTVRLDRTPNEPPTPPPQA
jgi:hypothetical protein